MTIEAKYSKATIFILILTLFINSCIKEQPNCNGNCVNISISGIIYTKPNGAPLTNVPVEVNWYRNAYCIGCTSYKVASGKSGNDGKFNFNTTIDSTFFKNYYLSVSVPSDTNYITVPGSGGVHYNEQRFYDFNFIALQNLKFEFYSKTFLNIKLHRTLSDNFTYFSVNHNFISAFEYEDYTITGPQFATDTTLRVQTTTNIYTKIVWRKTVIVGQSNQKTDSLICTNNGANIFNINY